MLVVYYDAKTAVGLGKELRDFGYQLTKRGFVTLSDWNTRVLQFTSSIQASV